MENYSKRYTASFIDSQKCQNISQQRFIGIESAHFWQRLFLSIHSQHGPKVLLESPREQSCVFIVIDLSAWLKW